MGGVVNKEKQVTDTKEGNGKKLADIKAKAEVGNQETNNREERKKDNLQDVQIVCKHGAEEGAIAYNTKVDLNLQVSEVVQRIERDVVKDKLFELLTSNSITYYLLASFSLFLLLSPLFLILIYNVTG
jgi:hypothetical protein